MFNLHTFNRIKYFTIYFEYKKEPFYYYSNDQTIKYMPDTRDEPYYYDRIIMDNKNVTWWTI